MDDDGLIVGLNRKIDLGLMMLGRERVVDVVWVDFEFNYLKAEKLMTYGTLARLFNLTLCCCNNWLRI